MKVRSGWGAPVLGVFWALVYGYHLSDAVRDHHPLWKIGFDVAAVTCAIAYTAYGLLAWLHPKAQKRKRPLRHEVAAHD